MSFTPTPVLGPHHSVDANAWVTVYRVHWDGDSTDPAPILTDLTAVSGYVSVYFNLTDTDPADINLDGYAWPGDAGVIQGYGTQGWVAGPGLHTGRDPGDYTIVLATDPWDGLGDPANAAPENFPLVLSDHFSAVIDPATLPFWELQPGSDVMATTIGALPKVGASAMDVYAGLVTVHHAITAAEANGCYTDGSQVSPGEGQNSWYLAAASEPASLDGYSNATYVSEGDPASVYVAYYQTDSTLPGYSPPLAFPPGWTPGNTTGSGSLVPYIGATTGGNDIYIGLVTTNHAVTQDEFDGTVPGFDDWFLAPANIALTPDAADSTTYASVGDPAGVYAAVYYVSAGSPAPTGLPPGWTFRPYGIGPVAPTDENAAVVIDDIAYVVSGYVLDRWRAGALVTPPSPELEAMPIASADIVGVVGEIYRLGRYDWTTDPTGGGTYQYLGPESWIGNGDWVSVGPDPVTYWPYIERYNLATKTWLPRIHMPERAAPLTYEYVTGLSEAGNAWEYAGPFHLPAGTVLTIPTVGSGETAERHATTQRPVSTSITSVFAATYYSAFASDASPGSNYASAAIPEGIYWIATMRTSGDSLPPESPEALGDSLGTRTTFHFPTYSAEGGFAAAIDGKLYFGGGDGDDVLGNEFFVYDPATQEFTYLPSATYPGHDDYILDYTPYGVVDGVLYGFWAGVESRNIARFDPTVGTWEEVVGDGTPAGGPYDQIRGIELDGKLYFVYDQVYVFDPVALTVEALTTSPVLHSPPLYLLVAGKIMALSSLYEGNNVYSIACDVYDPGTNTWAAGNTIGEPALYYAAGATHADVPYIFSGMYDPATNTDLTGVYGLTGDVSSSPSLGHLGQLSAVGGTLTVFAG